MFQYNTMASQLVLRQQLQEKTAQLEVIVLEISAISQKILKLSQKFTKEAVKIQKRLSKVQASRHRGNPANQWPHRPMTSSLRAFYQAKESKERKIWQSKSLLQQVFDHDKAILTSQRSVLSNEEHDLEFQIQLIRIRLH